MSGLYIHIPFCRQACRYCDFYFTVSLRYLDDLIDRLVEEIQIKAESHGRSTLDTLYLGGGTPSLLQPGHLDRLLTAVHRWFSFRKDPEITMECNPDDLDRSMLRNLLRSGFNRLSIGIQSFQDRDLRLMRRSHTSDQSEQSVRDAAGAGFDNITIDLMYGIPGQSLGEWESTLSRALSLPVQHLSAYHLTFETGTVFDHWRKQGKLFPVHEETSLVQYQLLREITRKEGFEHYEISNFAREGKQSEHNMLYWSGAAYMGVGPSAHSFDGTSRSWNISSLKKYMEAVRRREPFTEKENLSQEERYHDYLITSLRTRRGADPAYMERHFGETISRYFHRKSKPFLEGGSMYFSGEHISIHPDHWFITDHILRSLFVENPVNPGH